MVCMVLPFPGLIRPVNDECCQGDHPGDPKAIDRSGPLQAGAHGYSLPLWVKTKSSNDPIKVNSIQAVKLSMSSLRNGIFDCVESGVAQVPVDP